MHLCFFLAVPVHIIIILCMLFTAKNSLASTIGDRRRRLCWFHFIIIIIIIIISLCFEYQQLMMPDVWVKHEGKILSLFPVCLSGRLCSFFLYLCMSKFMCVCVLVWLRSPLTRAVVKTQARAPSEISLWGKTGGTAKAFCLSQQARPTAARPLSHREVHVVERRH